MAPQQFAVGTLGQFCNPDTVFIGLYMFGHDVHGDLCQIHIRPNPGGGGDTGIVQDIPDHCYGQLMGGHAVSVQIGSDIQEAFVNGIHIAEDKAFMLKLRDITMAAIEETRFGMVVERLRESTQVKITGRVQDVIELTGKTYGLNQPEQDGILNYLIQGGDLSQYGLSNAITRASQDVESYDRATALEGIGWQVATMPIQQWKEINSK